MGKLSNIILNENIRTTGLGPVGDQTGVILGNKVYKVRKAKTEADMERIKLANERRNATKLERKKQEEELNQLRAEKKVREEEAKAKALELRERLDKEIEIEKLKAEQKAIDQKERIEKDEANKKAQEIKDAADKAAYKDIVDQNEKRDQEYNDNKLKEKDFEKIPEEEKKETPRSSGILSTAARSLRF